MMHALAALAAAPAAPDTGGLLLELDKLVRAILAFAEHSPAALVAVQDAVYWLKALVIVCAANGLIALWTSGQKK